MSSATGKDRQSSPVPKSGHTERIMRKPSGIISPPTRKGMMSIDKEAFDKDIKLPTIYVYEDAINPQTLQKFKKFLLKIQGMKPMSDAGFEKDASEGEEGSNGNASNSVRKIKKIFINPELVKGCDLTHFVQHEIQPDASIVSSVGYESVKFSYDNWTLNQIIESVLPDDDDKVSGFSQIGHIVHLNLRDHLLPYKSLIGQVFLDKISNAKTVVNKINIIDNKYRNFQMDVLAGGPNTIVTVRENRCEFEFDFATVYWNPRLSSEHDRLVKLMEPHQIMYDVFAGVGPFTIPAAKRKIRVLANDLNPNSFKWLQHNVKKNKVSDLVKSFNLDGRAFIQEAAASDLKEQLLLLKKDDGAATPKRFHFVMNLPALAVDFLDSCWGILSSLNDNSLLEGTIIAVHVYCFIKDVEGFKEKAIQLVKTQLGYDLPDDNILQVTFVRNVAPNKEMLRVTFVLPVEVLMASDQNKPLKRKFCEIDESNLEQQRLQFNIRDHPGHFRTSTNTPHQIMSLKTGRCCPFSKEASHVKRAGILIIGDEILKGQVMDTNSHFMCKELYAYGIKVARIAVISDSIEEISKEIRKFSSRYDYVITTGGIGPTHDDMTYAGVAKAFGESLAVHDDMAVMVDKWLSHRGYDQHVLNRMSELPASAKLLFDSNLPLASFPIVIVRNVYIFPGVPQFVEKMFPRLATVFRSEIITFHSREIYVAKDEMSIISQINKAVDKFKDCVTFGSYPVYGNLYFSTRLTMESLSAEYVQKANDYLVGLMPVNTVVSFDKNAVANAATKVYSIVEDTNHELHHVVSKAVKIIEEALEKFKLESLCICFNGGRDCTALLHLFHAVVQKKFPDTNIKIRSLYIKGDNPFEEMETFIEQTSKSYQLKTWTYNAPIKIGLTKALEEHKQLEGVLMGTRRSDPSGEKLGYFQMTDAGWPQIMRISPMLDWSFSEVWTFLRSLTLPYCPLYDNGYTSIGNRSNTVPNPALAVETNDGKQKYRPAYTLVDSNAERTGRQ